MMKGIPLCYYVYLFYNVNFNCNFARRFFTSGHKAAGMQLIALRVISVLYSIILRWLRNETI